MSDGASVEIHEQRIDLDGRYAARIAALGLVLLLAGAAVAWLASDRPGPEWIGFALVVAGTVGFGAALVPMAAAFHVRHATWTLRVGADAVSLDIRTRSGRLIKAEQLPAADLLQIMWVEGDADIRQGVRLQARSGASLFVPADTFDAHALWAFAARRFPQLQVAARP